MVLVYVNFLGSVVNSQQACSSQLQATKKLEPNWLDRCGGCPVAIMVVGFVGLRLLISCRPARNCSRCIGCQVCSVL
jgi:hypothetical protein